MQSIFDAYCENNYSSCVTNSTQRLKFEVQSIGPLFVRCLSNFKLEFYGKALKDANRIIQSNFNYERAHLIKALCEIKLNKSDIAIETLTDALKICIDPDIYIILRNTLIDLNKIPINANKSESEKSVQSKPEPEKSISVKQASKPESEKSIQVKQASKPEPEKSIPVKQASKPEPEKSIPVKQASKPEPEKSIPVKQASKPESEKSIPVKQASKPESEKSIPVKQASKPEPEKSIPVKQASKPEPVQSVPVKQVDDAKNKQIVTFNPKNIFASSTPIVSDKPIETKSISSTQNNTFISSKKSFEKPLPNKEIVKEAIQKLHNKTGIPEIDEKLVYAYHFTNEGKGDQAYQLFSEVISMKKDAVAGYLGRGTIFALSGRISEAISDFTEAIRINPNISDGYIRRAQVYGQNDKFHDALNDLNKAHEADKSNYEAIHQRGMIYMNMKNFKSALVDLLRVSKQNHKEYHIWINISKCYLSMGDNQNAIENCAKAITVDNRLVENYIQFANIYREMGSYEQTKNNLEEALTLNQKNGQVHFMYGMLHFAVGEHKKALIKFASAKTYNYTDNETYFMIGVVQMALGMFQAAINTFNNILKNKSAHICWYHREISTWQHNNLDAKLHDLNMDLVFSDDFKESQCKRSNPADVKNYKSNLKFDSKIKDIICKDITTDLNLKKLINFCDSFGVLIQYACPGFFPNKRQHRMAGIAVVEIAQLLSDYWFNSKSDYIVKQKCFTTNNGNEHQIGWRDIYDIAIRYRRYSEPNDFVWWVDLLTKENFADGFGSHTPMITGQCYVTRYSCMIEKSLPKLKKLLIQNNTLSATQQSEIKKAKTCEQIRKIIKKDTYVITPCHSLRLGTKMQGTHLILEESENHGFEYAIKTPCTPTRWRDYDAELKHAFDMLTSEIRNNGTKIYEHILNMTFYWYNFMPISRGTAACGYIVMLACFLAIGKRITSKIPKDVQVDWNAILCSKPQKFIDSISSWLYKDIADMDKQEYETLPKMTETFDTLRKVIEAFNLE